MDGKRYCDTRCYNRRVEANERCEPIKGALGLAIFLVLAYLFLFVIR